MSTPLKQAKAGYVVFVDGAGAPSRVHPEFESAFAESDRLTQLTGKRAYVAELRAHTERQIHYVARIYPECVE
jgi:hypothetical protein